MGRFEKQPKEILEKKIMRKRNLFHGWIEEETRYRAEENINEVKRTEEISQNVAQRDREMRT